MVKSLTNLAVWLTSGVLLTASLAFVALATPLVGNRALIVRSGSMEPAISVGDIVVVRPESGQATTSRPGAYQAGDTIAFRVPGEEGMVVTHRITDVRGENYVTKGDANAEADGWAVVEGDIIGKELFTVPWLGTLLAFAKSRAGFLSLVVLPAAVVILSEARVIWREMRKRVPRLERGNPPFIPPLSRREPANSSLDKGRLGGISLSVPVRRFVDGVSHRAPRSFSVVGTFVVLLLMFSIMTPATFALYTDTGTSTNNVFTAAEDFGVGPGDVVINEVMWMGSTEHAQDEWIELRNTTSSPIDVTDWQVINAGAGASHIILSGTIPGNGFYLISNFDPSTSGNSALKNTLTADAEANVSLHNDGEQLTLQDASDVVIDQTPVPPPAWPAGVNGTDKQSMQRTDPPGDGTVDSNWFTCTASGCNSGTFWDDDGGNNYGTPKAANL